MNEQTEYDITLDTNGSDSCR